MHLRINSGVTLGTAAFMLISYGLTGCGGSGGGTPSVSAYKAKIAWPERARDITAPSSALSAKIEVQSTGTGGATISWIANRDANTAAHTQTYASTSGGATGSHNVTVTFYASADAGGAVLGSATFTETIGSQGEITSPVTVGSSVKSVVVQADQTVTAPGTKSLIAVAKDDAGQVVAVEAGSFFFTVTGGNGFLTIQDGLAKGITAGTATVTARVDTITSAAVSVKVNASATYREIGTLRDNAGRPDFNGISGDGTTLVGTAFVNTGNDFGYKPFKWTAAGGYQELQIGLTNPNTGSALRCNTDGSVIVGYSPGDITVGWVWKNGVVTWIRPIVTSNYAACTDVSDDGKYVVGVVTTVNGDRGFRWKNGNATMVFDEAGVAKSAVSSISNNGTIMIGSRSMTATPDQIHLVIQSGADPTMEVAFPAGVTSMHPYGASGDGSVVVGAADMAAGGSRPFRWSAASGVTLLDEGNYAFTCNADGSIVFGNDNAGTFVWTQAGGRESINAYVLKRFGLTLPKVPKQGKLVSDNGNSFAGGVPANEEFYEKPWFITKS